MNSVLPRASTWLSSNRCSIAARPNWNCWACSARNCNTPLQPWWGRPRRSSHWRPRRSLHRCPHCRWGCRRICCSGGPMLLRRSAPWRRPMPASGLRKRRTSRIFNCCRESARPASAGRPMRLPASSRRPAACGPLGFPPAKRYSMRDEPGAKCGLRVPTTRRRLRAIAKRF